MRAPETHRGVGRAAVQHGTIAHGDLGITQSGPAGG